MERIVVLCDGQKTTGNMKLSELDIRDGHIIEIEETEGIEEGHVEEV